MIYFPFIQSSMRKIKGKTNSNAGHGKIESKVI